jgi:hypothetical protein
LDRGISWFRIFRCFVTDIRTDVGNGRDLRKGWIGRMVKILL